MRNSSWPWKWPVVGPTPITEGLDSEIFDRDDFPYSETFVREAIQNSLDARLESSRHVRIDFRFHASECNTQRPLLQDVIKYRNQCNLPIPDDWSQNKISWLVVQDFHATGLAGDLNRRTSDFWNYWLNFGQSNKDSSGRGGRGIGRVTFLLASKIQTVIGYTRRIIDEKTPICGMTVLTPIEDDDESGFLSTHAYLAASERQSIYRLHAGTDFYDTVIDGFNFEDYKVIPDTGLALAIPYPHEELTRESVLAAAIENFAPTIVDGTLRLNVDGTHLDSNSINDIATEVSQYFREKSITDDPLRYLTLIGKALEQPNSDYQINLLDSSVRIDDLHHRSTLAKISEHLENKKSCVVDFSIAIKQDAATTQTKLRAVAAATPEGVPPLDRFFRDGMCLPKVHAQNPQDFDLLFFAGNDLLSEYLNLCEGKAHLDLSQSKAITQKLRSNKFEPPVYRIRDLMKSLPRHLRQLLYGDLSQPDSRVFESFFSVPDGRSRPRQSVSGQPTGPSTDLVSNPRAFKVSRVKNGLRVATEKKFTQWPANLYAEVAYADGRRRPHWHQSDFRLEELSHKYKECGSFVAQGNVLEVRECTSKFDLVITGFDSNREVVVSWRAF